jgi:hypothetical protein
MEVFVEEIELLSNQAEASKSQLQPKKGWRRLFDPAITCV